MQSEQPYVVVLAGGEGTRLAPLTRALYGVDLPKQFAVLSGEKSLLQQTVERAMVITPSDHILVVVTKHREALAREQLAPYPGVELVAQPRNLDTAPGLLLPLVRVLARSARATVMFLPSDHYIANDEPLLRALRQTQRGALRNRVTLIGVAPTGPEVEYGWIVRGNEVCPSGACAVARFEEKPAEDVATELWGRGALWNTFISSGPVHLFLTLARAKLPRHVAAFERYANAIGRGGEAEALETIYATMTAANFSKDVLAHARSLAVLAIRDTGWSDWGSPKRVFASLHGSPCHERLLQRIRGDIALAS